MSWRSEWLDWTPDPSGATSVSPGKRAADELPKLTKGGAEGGFVSFGSEVVVQSQKTRDRLGRAGVEYPPPDRPIQPDHERWLLKLSPADRRRWWRSVAEHYNRLEDWRKAEGVAVAEFTEGDS